MKPIEYLYLKNRKKINLDWKKVGPISGIATSILILGVVFSSFWMTNKADDLEVIKEDGVEVLVEKKRAPWWNNEYTYYRRINIQNLDDFESLEAGDWISLEINHQKYVEADKSSKNANDFRIVYLDDDTFKEVKFLLAKPNQPNTKIVLELMDKIEPFARNTNYFFYYGNEFAETPDSGSDYISEISSIDTKIRLSQEILAPITIETERVWMLKDTTEFEEYANSKIAVKINDTELKFKDSPQIQVGDDFLDLKQDDDYVYSYNFDPNDFESKEYFIRAGLSSNGERIESAKAKIIVSAPLYIAWTMDWEGYDTSDATITAMDEFSEKYDVPITHFWNPRISLSLSKARQDYLVKWLKDRVKESSDAIGLHLHMHFDMIKASGIEEVLKIPHWASNRGNGSDVPTSAYTKEDFVKMLEWSFTKFTNWGLEKPNMYRAGGWYADMEVLEALEDYDFILDSSGRTTYSFGQDILPAVIEEEVETPEEDEYGPAEPQEEELVSIIEDPMSGPVVIIDGEEIPFQLEYKLEGPWTLLTTTKPYKISKVDQNSSNSPTLNLWEFPNNGADSWKFSGAELTSRFKENYKEQPLENAQVVTYLTHPHSISIDIPKLDMAFEYIDQYKIEDDNGPVIYTTLDRCYTDFNE